LGWNGLDTERPLSILVLFPNWEDARVAFMNVIKRSTLQEYWEQHRETEGALKEWFRTVRQSQWTCMNDVQKTYAKAKPLNHERVRFEICGGNYRLIVSFKFSANIAFVKFIGTHAEYDRIDALTVDQF
jgi:mRNA interferase HigB